MTAACPSQTCISNVCRTKRVASSSTPQPERAWGVWQSVLHHGGEITEHPTYGDNPYRSR